MVAVNVLPTREVFEFKVVSIRALRRVPAGTANNLSIGVAETLRTGVRLLKAGLRVCANDSTEPASRISKNKKPIFFIVNILLTNILFLHTATDEIRTLNWIANLKPMLSDKSRRDLLTPLFTKFS